MQSASPRRTQLNEHPNKRRPGSLAESIAAAIRQYGWHRFDQRELELSIKRPLTVLERRAFNMAIDGLNQKTGERWPGLHPVDDGQPIPYDSLIARALPVRFSSAGTVERRYAAIRDAGRKRIRRSKSGRYREQGTAERGLDSISDQGAAVAPTRHDDTGTKYPESNFDEPPVDLATSHRWEPRKYMNVPVTRSAIGARYPLGSRKRLPECVIGQSRYDGHKRPVTRPPAAEEVSSSLADFLANGGTIETVPAGMTGKRYQEQRQAASV